MNPDDYTNKHLPDLSVKIEGPLAELAKNYTSCPKIAASLEQDVANMKSLIHRALVSMGNSNPNHALQGEIREYLGMIPNSGNKIAKPSTEWEYYSDVPDELAEKSLRAIVPGGSTVRDWFIPHTSEKAISKVRDTMKCAIFHVVKTTVEKLERELQAKQAKIDRLMLEYCPDEVTPEQLHEWAIHQRLARKEVP